MQIFIDHDSKRNIQIYGDEGFTLYYCAILLINHFILMAAIHFSIPSVTAGNKELNYPFIYIHYHNYIIIIMYKMHCITPTLETYRAAIVHIHVCIVI